MSAGESDEVSAEHWVQAEDSFKPLLTSQLPASSRILASFGPCPHHHRFLVTPMTVGYSRLVVPCFSPLSYSKTFNSGNLRETLHVIFCLCCCNLHPLHNMQTADCSSQSLHLFSQVSTPLKAWRMGTCLPQPCLTSIRHKEFSIV